MSTEERIVTPEELADLFPRPSTSVDVGDEADGASAPLRRKQVKAYDFTLDPSNVTRLLVKATLSGGDVRHGNGVSILAEPNDLGSGLAASETILSRVRESFSDDRR